MCNSFDQNYLLRNKIINQRTGKYLIQTLACSLNSFFMYDPSITQTWHWDYFQNCGNKDSGVPFCLQLWVLEPVVSTDKVLICGYAIRFKQSFMVDKSLG